MARTTTSGRQPVLVTLGNGRRALIAGQKSGVVHAVDPDRQGEILWQRGSPGRAARRHSVGYCGRRRQRLRGGFRRAGRGSAAGQPEWAAVAVRDAADAQSKSGRRTVCPGFENRADRVAHEAPWLWKHARMQPGPVGGHHGNPGGRLFGRPRRAPEGIQREGRPDHLGRRHATRYNTVNSVEAKGGSLDGRASGRRWDGVRELRIFVCWTHPRQRPARILD